MLSSPENPVPKERPYNNMTDLCPLEHLFIASSLKLAREDKIFNKKALKEDETLIGDADLLLKPFGLTTGESRNEDIRKRRKDKGKLSGSFICFKSLERGYELDYHLNEPDKDGIIPNLFKFQIKKEDSRVWDKNNKEDLDAFGKVELHLGFLTYGNDNKPFFSLTKDEDTGILTLTFVPLQEAIKQ